MKQGSKMDVRKYILALVGGLTIFACGMLVGNGTIAIQQNVSHQQELPRDLDYAEVEEVYDSLKNNFDGDLTLEALMNGLKEGLASAGGDVYTEYLSAEENEEFDAELNGSFTGIGAELTKHPESKAIMVVTPISGFPADKAGLRPQDIIAAIDGEPAFDLSISEAVDKIRGPKETNVKLSIIRNDTEQLELEITRAEITIPSVESEILDGNVGYLKISRFAPDTSGLARGAAQSFQQAEVKKVIVDLRSNPGGLLDSSVDVASLWLKNQTVLQEKRGDKVIRTFKSQGQPLLEDVETVVLINGGSASASEIVAGALKDHGAAKLMGEKTFGKGSVQQIQPLSGGGALKVTIARWFTPDGKNIDKEGIEPDTVVERTEEDYVANRDPQLEAAKQALR